MSAPRIAGVPSTNFLNASSASISASKPDGIVTGEMLVAFVRSNGSTSPTDFSSPGFTRRGYTFVPSDTSGRVTGIFTYPVTDSSAVPATITFTKSVADTRLDLVVVRVENVDLADPILGNSAGWNGTGAPTVVLNSYTLASDAPGLHLYAWATEVVAPNASAPTATPGTQIALVATDTLTSVTRTVLWTGYEEVAAISTGAKSLTWVSTAGSAATGVVLRGLAAPPEPVLKFASISEFLRTKGATVIHRAPAGYTQSSVSTLLAASEVGFSAFEMSVAFSSDLKPFLSGFQYLDPLALNDPAGTTLDPLTMTWDTISTTYQNTSGPTTEPLALLADALDATVGSGLGIALVDPKHGFATLARVNAMLDICDAHGGPTKILIKFDSPTTNTVLVNAAHSRGYQAMNFWGSDSASLAAQQGPWDILGGLYSAGSSMWTALKSYGKKTWAGIVPNQAALDQAVIDTSADFYMVQSLAITPVGPSAIPDPAIYAGASNRDLEIRWLRKISGITAAASLSDLRLAVYGPSEHAYWATRSGLSIGSLADHKITAMRLDTGMTDGSLADVSRVYFAKNGL